MVVKENKSVISKEVLTEQFRTFLAPIIEEMGKNKELQNESIELYEDIKKLIIKKNTTIGMELIVLTNCLIDSVMSTKDAHIVLHKVDDYLRNRLDISVE